MHGLDLGGRAILPIRAVPFASGGDITPLAIALALGSRRRFVEEREFCTRLVGYWLAPDGTPRPMLAAEFKVMLEEVIKLAQDMVSMSAQIQALLAGVFIYWDDLNVLLDEINEQRCASPPNGPGLAPIALSKWPRVSELDARLILEGFETVVAGRTAPVAHVAVAASMAIAPSTFIALDSHGYDPDLQQRANDVAAELQERKRRSPTKSEVVKVLAKDPGIGKSKENLLRRIRKEWAPGQRRTKKRI